MQVLKVVYIICAAVAGLAIFIAALKSRHARKSLLISAAAGIAALLAVSFTGSLTGFDLPVNLWTLSCAAGASVPGVILMTAVKLIWVL